MKINILGEKWEIKLVDLINGDSKYKGLTKSDKKEIHIKDCEIDMFKTLLHEFQHVLNYYAKPTNTETYCDISSLFWLQVINQLGSITSTLAKEVKKKSRKR